MSAGPLSAGISICPFQEQDTQAVQDLFVLVNRQLAPPSARDAFEAYIARSLTEEMVRITAYYGERGGGFWVARRAGQIVGMFGLERAAQSSGHAMELRRMYVDPSARRGGIARSMLQFAEAESRRAGASALELSTSELQAAAL